jgi:hypothetical protein
LDLQLSQHFLYRELQEWGQRHQTHLLAELHMQVEVAEHPLYLEMVVLLTTLVEVAEVHLQTQLTPS